MIDKTANIGKNCIIHPLALIEGNVVIGDNVTVGPFCIIRERAQIGANCSFTAYCEVRSDVIIGRDTTFGSRCTICAGTVIGDNVTVKYGFVSTTMDFNKKIDLEAGKIGDNTMIGANVILMPGCDIGNNAIIGACSQVRSNVKDGEVWFGNPAKLFKVKNA